MNWLGTAWITLASASATLGLLHLLIWRSETSEYAHLLFFALTSSIAAVAAFELAMMQSAGSVIGRACLHRLPARCASRRSHRL